MSVSDKMMRHVACVVAVALTVSIDFCGHAVAQSHWGDHPATYDACGRMLMPPVVNGRVDYRAIEATPEFKAGRARASELGWEAAAKRDRERSRLGLAPLRGEALRKAVVEDSNRIARQIEQEQLAQCNPSIAGIPAALDDQSEKIKKLERRLDEQTRQLEDANARIMEQELRSDD